MSRMNNQSRSLRIISKQNGWDPDKIQGTGEDISRVYHERETPFSGDTDYGFDGSKGEDNHPGEDRAGWNKPEAAPKTRHTSGANPYPGMPGSGGRK